MMKAVRLVEYRYFVKEGIEVVRNIPIPKPRTNEILIKVKSAGINPGDVYNSIGNQRFIPYTPGSDGSGLVESADAASKFKRGDFVYFRNSLTGSYAEYTKVDQDNVFPLPGKLSFQAAASLGVPYFTVYRALIQKCQPKAGQSLLVHGASGAMGLAVCQIGKRLGLQVLGTASSEEGQTLAQYHGAEAVFNHSRPGYQGEIMRATSGKGVDNIIEMLANVNLEADLVMAAAGGKIALVGNRGNIKIAPGIAIAKDLTILGVTMGHASKEDVQESAEFFNMGIEEGWLRPDVGIQYTLDDLFNAHKDVIAKSGGIRGKKVINME